MKKLSDEQRWNAAKEVANKISISSKEIEQCKKEDIQPFFDVSEMPEKLNAFDGKDYEEEDAFEYFKELVAFNKAAL